MEYQEFLFAAFAIVWIVLFVYILVLMRRQTELRHKIDSLETELRGKNR
jgi:CcmD family protein